MVEAFFQGLFQVLQWPALGYMLLGVGIGFWVGILPGIGGIATLALMLPFIYKMAPVEAFAFLLGMHSVVATTGDITSILFGVPGEPTTAAMILDGHAMAKKGEAGRALGAALMSSLVGSVVGAVALAASIPVVRPLVLSFGSPELFMLTLVGMAFVSSVSGGRRRGLLRGAVAAGLGLLFSMVGMDPQAGVPRYTLGHLYLWGGLDLVPVVVGLFAIPEVVDLAVRGTAIGGSASSDRLGAGVWRGFADAFHHFGLTLRCSLIGTFIGILPGLGGAVAQWIAYGHAVQSAKTASEREGFGKGDVRGVLGPGAAVNSKEGGALIPTVAFGVPGSSAMSILLGAFLILGLVPGPDMLTKHLPVTFALVWTLVIANVVAVLLCLVFLKHIAVITVVRGTIIVPFILVLTFIGSYTANNHLGDLVVTLLAGGLGYWMVRCGWPRPPLVLGFVLGRISENYLFISTARYGAGWLGHPVVILLMLLVIGVATYPFFQERRVQRTEGGYAA